MALKAYIDLFAEPSSFSVETFTALPKAITEAKIEIAELIRKESGAYMIDYKIDKFLGNIKIKKEFPKNGRRKNRNKHD
ncbi:MAG: hypothetical protein FWB73_03095 [Treponema sp.]|nr:hypothetical protein [Treponema sp.]